MAVLPENMDKLNPEDVQGSLSIIENYIRYMGERIEFAMTGWSKKFSDTGTTNAEMYILLSATINDLSALRSTVNEIAGDTVTIKSSIGELEKRIEALEGITNEETEV